MHFPESEAGNTSGGPGLRAGAADDASRNPRRPSLHGKALFWAPIAPLVALDLSSKHLVFDFLAQKQPWQIEDHRHHDVFDWGWLNFDLVSWGNPGTIWGLGQTLTSPLIVLRCLVVVAILWFVLRSAHLSRTMLLVLGVILAGAIGNLYDNFTRPKSDVRDFLRFTGDWWGWSWGWPAFNVADSCICVGAITFAVLLWRADARQRVAAAAAERGSAG